MALNVRGKGNVYVEDQLAINGNFDLRLTDGHVEYILTHAQKFHACLWKPGGRMSSENYLSIPTDRLFEIYIHRTAY